MTNSAERNPLIIILEELSLSRNLAAFGDALEHLACELCAAELAFYHRYDPLGSTLTRVSQGTEHEVVETTLAGFCALHCEAVETRQEPTLTVPEAGEVKLALSVPVRRYGSTVGVLTVVNPEVEITSAELEEIAQVAAVTQDFVLRFEDLQALSSRTEDFLVQAVEARPGQDRHVVRVAQLATGLAELLDMSSQSRQQIWRAAQFHDIGKLVLAGRPQAELERFHAQAGGEYLKASRVLRELAPLVENHHERMDGSGPRALTGGDVSMEAWVLALAEALEEFQQGHRHLGLQERLQKFLEAEANLHHPAVVDALGGLMVSGRLEELLA